MMTEIRRQGASRVCFVRFALFRQFKLYFWVDFTKNRPKKTRVRVVVKIVKRKNQKTVGKPQNRHWELSKFSLRCILEFWNEV